MKFEYVIQHNEMLKSFLQRHQYSKKTISAIKHNGALIINNSHVTVRKMMMPGDELTIALPDETPSSYLIPSRNPIEILYEDDYLIIVSKPNYLNSTPSREHPHDSLIERVLYYLNVGQLIDTSIVPHIVTRLDRNTRGIVIFAKHGHIHHLMTTSAIDKRYMCVCYGQMQLSGVIEEPIARDSQSIITRKIDASGKYAKTSYETVMTKPEASLCEIKLHTGRTHQIRVHFNYVGHPLVGDDLYEGSHPEIHTQSLQCYKVTFIHPILSLIHI